MASYRSIDYSLRPGKYAERRMMSEAFRNLHPFGAVDSYRYVGMGSLWFADFTHFHKSLGIKDMISIEREEAHKPRFEFNKPFSSIKMIYESTSVALPKLDWSVRSIVWLDFDDQLNRNMLEDAKQIAARANAGTVFCVSAQVENPPVATIMGDDGEEEIRTVDSIQELRDRYTAGAVPIDARDSDLRGWALAIMVRKMFRLAIEDALAARNAGRPPQQCVEFHQFAAFEYADGARMTTVCGVFLDKGQTNLLQQCGFQQLAYYQADEDATRLVLPILTPREMRMLETRLPDGKSPGLGGNIVPPRDADAFAGLYRYLPSFAPLEG